MAGQACAGPCNGGSREAWGVFLAAREAHADAVDRWVREGTKGSPPPEPVEPEVSWRPGEPLVCGRCRATTRRALLEVDGLAAVVSARGDGLRPASRWSRVSGSRPKPAVSPDAELLDELVGGLLEFEDRGRALLRCGERVVGARSGVARGRAVSWLVEQLDSVLAREELSGLVEWSLDWEGRLRRAVEEEPPGWTPARCRCGERSLRWDAKVGYFVCGACGSHVSAVEERGLVADEAG